jgi:hypothetical protein
MPNSKMNCIQTSHSKIREPHKKMQADVEMESPREDKVERFPKVVPMEHKLLGDNFYVRDCYAEYYTRVVTLLKGPGDCALEEKKAREEFEREAKAEIKRQKKAEKIEEEKKARAELEEEKEAGDQVDEGQEPPTTPGPGDKDGVTITGTPGETAIAYSPGRSDFSLIAVCV